MESIGPPSRGGRRSRVATTAGVIEVTAAGIQRAGDVAQVGGVGLRRAISEPPRQPRARARSRSDTAPEDGARAAPARPRTEDMHVGAAESSKYTYPCRPASQGERVDHKSREADKDSRCGSGARNSVVAQRQQHDAGEQAACAAWHVGLDRPMARSRASFQRRRRAESLDLDRIAERCRCRAPRRQEIASGLMRFHDLDLGRLRFGLGAVMPLVLPSWFIAEADHPRLVAVSALA